ncbi:MAG TPA: hypothetical protein VFC24_17270 [Casimicrobiaceae bacterium]|nr:hypothetical protein [Casimicrobiaceae bacterium]
MAILMMLSLVGGYAVHVLAQPRADLRPAMMPIASSSSNGISFAWFYDQGTRSVVVCRAGSALTEAPDCKSHATLP